MDLLVSKRNEKKKSKEIPAFARSSPHAMLQNNTGAESTDEAYE